MYSAPAESPYRNAWAYTGGSDTAYACAGSLVLLSNVDVTTRMPNFVRPRWTKHAQAPV